MLTYTANPSSSRQGATSPWQADDRKQMTEGIGLRFLFGLIFTPHPVTRNSQPETF